jgi:hypothetical protein
MKLSPTPAIMLLPVTIRPLCKPRMLARWEHVACYEVPSDHSVLRRGDALVVPYYRSPMGRVWEHALPRHRFLYSREPMPDVYAHEDTDVEIVCAAATLAALPATGLQGAYDRAYRYAMEIDTVEAWAIVANRLMESRAWQQQAWGVK